MTRPLVALIMAGGTGTRLYPASRSDRPKQFLSLLGDDSLLSQTVERAGFADEIFVCTGEDHADLVREHVPEVGVLVEPEPKDTGPALTYAAHRIREQVGDCVLLCMPSDHHIAGDFETTARRAASVAVETEGVVTVGIEPTRPATGYGYIEPGTDYGGHFDVAQFREKPDAETAEQFVKDGFYWNAGLFAWTPDAFLQEARDSPLSPLVSALEEGESTDGFDAVESVSVDYAVMERTDEASVVPADFEWDDLGSWDALERLVPGENTVLGDVLTIDASGNVVASDKHVSLVGVDDLVVTSYDDRVLVVSKSEAQRVREVVSELRAEDRF
ncbi:mannose-1-phosphate guanylyltransferase [Haladaptatus litoreus]|uniref:Mannose-1-phosphate guanylyltransferase n=1 Tax=Haladaptatus litoreus TaxID=553468 RepID=A0A1N7BT39_9EURY|nr:sugar phosphate nucleotidyltransferase [Haladaptatus litoreus]SIR54498.1 mannose-1-phosphate guanylyltransferase [Haladaptatus litoreus]